MNTEIFDYLKALSKKEYFFSNFIISVLSIIVILLGCVSIRSGATVTRYAMMFACLTVILGANAYKCLRRGSKNGWVFVIMTLLMAAITGIAILAMVRGGM